MYTSVTDIETLVSAFNNRTLPKEQFTHQAHLTTGIWYCCNYPLNQAIGLIRSNIRQYNVAAGGANTETNGYHETLTVFWMTVIDFCVRHHNPAGLLQTCNTLIASPLAATTLPFEFYNRDTVLSTHARANFVPPDKQPLTDEVLKGMMG